MRGTVQHDGGGAGGGHPAPPRRAGAAGPRRGRPPLAAASLLLLALSCGGGPGDALTRCLDSAQAASAMEVLVVPVLNGVPSSLPAGIGVAEGCTRPVHTLDGSSVVRVAATTGRGYTLGDLFLVWGDANPYRGLPVESVSLNGARYDKDYRGLVLAEGQRVVVAFREQ